MAKNNRAFRTTKIALNSSSFPTDSHDKLESLFFAYEAAKTDAVAERRKADSAAALATQREQQVLLQLLTLLSTAAEYEPMIGSEKLWIVYKDDGILTFEGITERLMRNNFRAQQHLLSAQVNDHSDMDDGSIYEDGEEEN